MLFVYFNKYDTEIRLSFPRFSISSLSSGNNDFISILLAFGFLRGDPCLLQWEIVAFPLEHSQRGFQKAFFSKTAIADDGEEAAATSGKLNVICCFDDAGWRTLLSTVFFFSTTQFYLDLLADKKPPLLSSSRRKRRNAKNEEFLLRDRS